MKHTLIFISLLTLSSLAHAQLKDGNYVLSSGESEITWKVDYSIGSKGHEGTLKLSSGSILVKDGIIQSGSFIIDMNSVHVTDMPADDGGKDLEEHLKAKDFLSTDVYPKGSFTVLNSIRSVPQKLTVSGNLILKGISNTISFPATITETKSGTSVQAEFKVNRTQWGINYQSGIIGAVKDEMISDDMNITLNFTFKRAQ